MTRRMAPRAPCTHGGELDLVPEAGETFLKVLRPARETQRALRSRRAREAAPERKVAGLAVGYPLLGKRVVRHQGVPYLEWDKTELRHIAEIARRVPLEGVEVVARDFFFVFSTVGSPLIGTPRSLPQTWGR